ncbi:MAG: hybrid sensor histidine kinase/response regulator, partial [Caldimonas sp.]
EQMRSARDAAEAANRAKSTFLAAASHDLRQPVHALGLYLAAFENESLGARQLALAQRMNASVAAMDSMFGALLDISRMDAGAVQASAEPFDIVQLVSRLVEEFSEAAREKGLRLALHVGRSPRGVRTLADPMLLERVMRNLIGNAVKYTHRGGVLVSLRLCGTVSKHWRLEVWDTGIGIADAEKARVFEEFYQVGNPERDRSNGLGLGLAIVQRLTDLMQVPLTLDSIPGRGTRFRLELPATAAALRQPVESRRPGSLAGMIVAVVEDDREVRHGMQTLLLHWGCIACEGADADEVLARAREMGLTTAQAIVADFRLRHDRSGLDEIARLRAAWRLAVPALLVTGDSAPRCIAELHASGHDWLSKPVSAPRLRSWLQAVAVTHHAIELGSTTT